MLNAAVTCPPLLTQVVNATLTTLGTGVLVTCGKGQGFTGATGSEGNVTSQCSAWGRWTPDVPHCVD